MPTDDDVVQLDATPGHRAVSRQREITEAVVAIAKAHIGRGPKSVRVVVDRDMVVVVLYGVLGRVDRLLVENDHADEVLAMRRGVQVVLRPALVAEVQRITGRRVASFMSTNSVDPDTAAEIFLLEPVDAEAPG